jgi:hypothetical protein
MIEFIGIACFSLGVATLYATWRVWVDQPRQIRFTDKLAEALEMPRYVQRAQMYCRIYGVPESEWERFQHRAIADIILEAYR